MEDENPEAKGQNIEFAGTFKHPNRNTLNLYGISKSDFWTIFYNQDRRCAICNALFGSKKHPVIDHDHLTGKVRGLLCYGCNIGLGQFGDDIETLEIAIKYLKNPTW